MSAGKVKLTFEQDGSSGGSAIYVPRGTSILAAANRNGVKINQRCAGKASCLMCKVKIADQRGVSAPNQKEQFKLDNMLQDTYRLACQTLVLADTVVTVPEDPLKALIRAQLEANRNER